MKKIIINLCLISCFYACVLTQYPKIEQGIYQIKNVTELAEIQDKIAEAMAMENADCSTQSQLLKNIGEPSKTEKYWNIVYDYTFYWFGEKPLKGENLTAKRNYFHFDIWKISYASGNEYYLVNETTKTHGYHGFLIRLFELEKDVMVEKKIRDIDIEEISDTDFKDELYFGKIDSTYQKDSTIFATCSHFDSNDVLKQCYTKKIRFDETGATAMPYLIGDSLNYSIFKLFSTAEKNRFRFNKFQQELLQKVSNYKDKKIYFVKIPYDDNLSRTEIFPDDCTGAYIFEEDINTEQVKIIGEISCKEVKESINWQYENQVSDYPILTFKVKQKKITYSYKDGHYIKN